MAVAVSGTPRSDLVSVVLPTYNRAHLVGRAIRSVLAQTFRHWELLVVDDGSQDDTEQVVRQFVSEAVRYFRLPQNRGGAAALNHGIRNAHGVFVGILEDDDEWLPHKLELQVEAFRTSRLPNLAVVYCWGLVEQESVLFEPPVPDPPLQGWVLERLIKGERGFPHDGLLIRKEALEVVGGYDERLRRIWDRDIIWRLALVGAFELVPERLVVVHNHGDRASNATVPSGLDDLIFMRKFRSEFAHNSSEYAFHLYRTAVHLWLGGRRRSARRVLLKALRLQPWKAKRWGVLLLINLGANSAYTRMRTGIRWLRRRFAEAAAP